MESAGSKEGTNNSGSKFNQEIHSKVIRAGKRTYFFDVKSTRSDEFYLTITESKKRFGENGKFSYEKHKIFLYKEDFEKFMESLQEVVDYIFEKQPEDELVSRSNDEEYKTEAEAEAEEAAEVKDYTNVEFEDI
ncbi:MAG: DUF3276 family protein [Draconibacterium sp.]